MRVLQQVQQRLLHLRAVEARRLVGQVAVDAEGHLRPQPLDEQRPRQRLEPRCRQLREPRVAVDEAFEMPRALLDGREDRFEPRRLPAPRQLRAGMRERRDRRERIVEFVADHADHLLPRLHFLPAQLAGEPAQQQQFVRAPVEPEAAAREVVHLFLVGLADREQPVAAAIHRLAQRRRRRAQQGLQREAFELAALVQQPAGREIAVDDVPAVADQQHRHRRVLHHRVEQQLALHEREPLFAQHAAEFVVRGDEVAEFVAVLPAQAETEIAVAIAERGAGERPEQRQRRPHGPRDQGDAERDGGEQCQGRRQHHVVEQAMQHHGRADCRHRDPDADQREMTGDRSARCRHPGEAYGRAMPSRSIRR